ncbi:MAG: FKBP-type peptidyl-prolyl cis-trans isomerase [Candidatus Aminicenantes bacterium]|nr:FKBP-type peptidyl-prolyl cis-trans isomerase [Candidatus Aminicenantes bacterium]
MNKTIVVIIFILLLLNITCTKSSPSKKSEIKPGQDISLDTPEKTTSYSMGYNMGKNFKEIYEKIDQDTLIQGIIDAINQKDPQISMKEISDTLMKLQKQVAEQKKEEQKTMAEQNKKIGTQFLEKNAKEKGVKVTASGLQYKIINQGKGANPVATDRVRVHYRGKFIDGKEFDSSYKRGEPTTFRLDQVIPGWTESLQLMNTGAKYVVFVPSELAYGERGAGNVIGPNSTLIFEIELLEILKTDSK